ncbi:MAG: hypothetical protein ACKODT_01210 [Fluviibacter sp.]
MGGIDISVARCEEAGEMVLTDQTQHECKLEHHCPKGTVCPLDGCFAIHSGIVEAHPECHIKKPRSKSGR